jgi:cytochrome P450
MAMTTTVPAADALHRVMATAEGWADPYPLYRQLLEQADVYRSEHDDLWYAFRHRTCRQVLQDNRLGHDSTRPLRRPGMGEVRSPRLREHFERRRRNGLSMVTANPPDHTRLRGLVNRAFTPRRVEGLRDRITELVDQHLDRIAEAGSADVMADLALPLPVSVISELVGIPEEGRALFHPLLLDGRLEDGREPTDEQLREVDISFEERNTFFRSVIEHRRSIPQDDMLSALVAVRDGDDGRLSEAELMATVFLLYFAGFVTTTNLIGNGLLALFQHPGEMARLWADGNLVPSAVEEMLRYDSPVQFVTREVLEAAEVDSVALAPGEAVVAVLGAANRDPAHFPEPDRFDVGRTDNHPLSFGAGIHFCLGAPLARLEAQVVFARMRERFTHLEPLVDEPPRARGFLRGLQSLPVRVRIR